MVVTSINKRSDGGGAAKTASWAAIAAPPADERSNKFEAEEFVEGGAASSVGEEKTSGCEGFGDVSLVNTDEFERSGTPGRGLATPSLPSTTRTSSIFGHTHVSLSSSRFCTAQPVSCQRPTC
jgi:hypothetical protein